MNGYDAIQWNLTIWIHSKANYNGGIHPFHPISIVTIPILGVYEIGEEQLRNGILIWLVSGMVYGIRFATLDQLFVFEWSVG